MGHIPYRDWCPISMKAQGRDMGRMKDGGKERLIPEYSWDYCFPGDELGFKWSVLVGKEKGSRSLMATAVPNKGGGSKLVGDKSMEFIWENEDSGNKMIVKTDQEPSIKCVITDLVEERIEGGTVVEESPVKSSGSNGIVEKGVQEVECRIRSLFLGLEERIGRRLDAKERIVAFISEYAAYLINRLSQGTDGKVAYERMKGTKPTVLGIEFGDKVFHKLKHTQKLQKINARWDLGICLGVRKRSNELAIAAEDGIHFVQSV